MYCSLAPPKVCVCNQKRLQRISGNLANLKRILVNVKCIDDLKLGFKYTILFKNQIL